MAGPVYATVSDFSAFGINESATKGYDSTKINRALAAASRVIDSYLRDQFVLPLTAWEDDIRRACCILAVWDVVSGRGYNPEAGADVNIKQRADAITTWLRDVAAGRVVPAVTDSSQGSASGRPGSRPVMVSSSQRGWSTRGSSGGSSGPFQGD